MPDKYYIDGNQELRVVPEGKEKIFLSKYPGSREATSKELSDFESKRAKMQTSTQRESNIQNRKDSSTAIIPANTTLGSDNTSIYPNQPNIGVTNYAEEFAKNNKPQLSLKQEDNTPTKIFSEGSPFSQPKEGVISDAMKKVQNKRAQESDQIVESAIDEYDSYKNWIDQVNADPEMSDSIKKNLNDWYTQNYKDANNATDNIRIPNLVRDYLEKNKKPVSKSVYVPGSSMFGGGSFVEGTIQENTPEQMAMIADFLVNSPKGRLIMEDEKLYLKRLDENIDDLEKNINNTTKARNESLPKTIGMRDYLTMPKWEKDKFNKDRESIRSNIEKEYPISDIINSQNQLNELKKLREAYNDGDRGAIKQLLKEFGRRLPYDLANAASLGTIGLTEESSLSSVLNDPKNVLTRKGYNLVKEYQQAHEIDRSIAQDIARGTTQTLPFITQFIATGGVISSLGKGLLSGASKIGLNAEKIANIGSGLDKTSKIGKGLSIIGNGGRIIATDALDAGARSLIMPNTYADAYARSIDNPGSYLDNFTHSWFVNTIENYSEKFGAHLPGIGIKNPKLKMIMDQTGIQGFPEEFAEEQLSTILNSAFDTGQADWSDLVDPRNQLITAGTIGLLQVPYASVSAGGYAAGKYRDITQKRSIRKGYNSNLSNMNNVFGKESEALINTINQIIDSDNSEGLGINSFISNVSNDAELTDKEKDAVFKYTMSYVPFSALNQAKQEAVSQVEQQVTHAVESNSNPEMNAIVSAKLSGAENPMHVVSGNIVQREDGSIDREASDKQIFYVDAEGNKQVTSIDFIENIEESIPTQDAIAQLTESEIANIISQQENEEVREYTPGEIVTADIYGNGIPFTGQITEVTEAGNYIIVGTQSGQRAEIQPRQIINQDNIQGVDNGSLVQYRNEKGEIVKGTVNDAYGLRPQGMMDIDGNVIPISNVIGLAQNSETGIPVSEQDTNNVQSISQQNEDITLPQQSNVKVNEPRVFEIEDGLSAKENTDGTYSIDKQFPKSELKKADNLINKLNEDYSDNGLVFELVQLPKQDASNPFEKPLWGIVARMQQEAPATQIETSPQNRENEHLWSVVDNSDNPIEISSAYNEAMQSAGEEILQEWQKQLLGRKINRSSFERFGDRNYINGTIARSWFNRKGEETPLGAIDVVSQELGVAEQDIIDFIINHPSNRIKKGNELTQALNDKFKQIAQDVTGREVGGIESNSGKLFLSTLEYVAINTPTNVEVEFMQSDVITNIPSAVEFFLNDYMNLDDISDFNQFRDTVEEADKQGYFMFPLEPKDKETILNYINNAERQAKAVQGIGENVSSQQVPENVESTTINEQIARAESETNINPTEAQKEAGNYKKGKVTIQGLDISIEQPRGSVRSGTDQNGKEWSIEMQNTYGYIGKTKSRDGDHIDVFLGNSPGSKTVFVVDQINQDQSFDEHKVMLGFDSIEQAREAYLSNYEEGWQGLGNITQTDIDTFKKWAKTDGRRIKPFADYKSIQGSNNEGSDFDISNYIGKELYHGSPDGEITKIDPYVHTQNWKEGIGFYTTESKDKAKEYANGKTANAKRKSDKGGITKITFPGDVKVLNMDAKVDIPLWKDISKNLGIEIPLLSGSNMDAYNELISSYNEEIGTTEGQYAIEEALLNHGYDASTHMEGLNSTPHRVFIWKNEFKLPYIGEVRLQSSTNVFKPINEQTFNSLVDRLKKTGLARDVITDKATFDAKLDEVINDNATAKQVLSEMETIKQEAISNGTFMLAPNGNPSKLNENQWLQVRTKPFLDWFGNWINNPEAASKVVDENGEPMVVYHGSNNAKKIKEFSNARSHGRAYWFSPDYDFSLFEFGGEKKGNILSVFLSSKNILDFRENKEAFNDFSTWIYEKDGAKASADMESYVRASGLPSHADSNIYEYAREKGYDGVVLQERVKAMYGDDVISYAVFDPTQIKSAISNNGEFDSSNPDIRMQIAMDMPALEQNVSDNYNTKLDSKEEQEYQIWRNNLPENLQEEEDYDLRGLWKENKDQGLLDDNSHFPDKYKKPNHITFSKESIYSKGTVEGGIWDNKKGHWTFYPSYFNLQQHSKEEIQDYFDKYEKDSSVIFPIEVKFMRSNLGDVYGFVTPDGTVYLDNTRMNANTPVHEFGHLWNSFIKENNNDMYNRGAELVKESEYWQRVNNNPSYRNLSDEAKVDEALAMAIGDKGEAIVNRNLKQRFVDWLSDVWKSIKEVFGIKTDVAIEDMPLSEFISKASNELLSGKNISNTEDRRNSNTRYQFIGKQGAENLDKVEEASIRIDNLQVAREMENANKDAKSIKLATGWERGADGKWRYEIVDAKIKDIISINGTEHKRNESDMLWNDGELSDVINAKELFDAYPQLRNIKINTDSLIGEEGISNGSYSSGIKKIDIHASDLKYLDSILNHEIQHAIQDIEGFARGGSISSSEIGLSRMNDFLKKYPEFSEYNKAVLAMSEDESDMSALNKAIELSSNLDEELMSEYNKLLINTIGISEYKRLAGEVEARNVQSRMSMTFQERLNSLAEETEDVARKDQIFINNALNNNQELRYQSMPINSVNELADATNSTMSDDVRNQLDIRIKNFRFRIREAWEDRHLAVKEFLDTLRKNGVEISDYNDYYKQATHINGKIDAQLEHYNETYQKPLNKSISDIEREDIDYRSIENYAILKHGLERNEWMRQNAINQYKTNHPDATQEQIDKYTETLPDDYSGITAVQEEVGMSAENFITEFENKAGKKLIDNFWKKVKDSTQYSISKQLEGGLIDKKTFDDLTGRYDYYIPLRGHDAETAEDRWDYSPNMGTYFVAPLIKAKGRKTRSESPFAYIFSMAQSSINSANRNWLNQTILRLARKDTTGLMSISQSWYVMDGMNADGVPAYKVESPTFSENPEQYRQNIEDFEERMLKLAEQGFAYPSGSKLDIGGLFIKRNQADQHEIHVWQNGKEYTVYINANPAVARAINGVNAKDLHKDLRFIAKVSRQMAANFTTRNPIFVATNFSRDYIFASSILPVKEDTKYAIQFQRNMLKSSGALQRYIRGKADLTKQQDQYVIEYIMNGAKTGFSHIIELDKVQKRIEQEIKKGENKNAFRSFLDILEGCNEFAENLSRLSVYITSREQGRSITQSISDAKEVTVNFNRSGAGGYGAAWFRSLYLFVNAGIQALSNFAKVAQKNKGKTALLISGYAMTGFLMPILTALIGGDDGLDEYMKLSDWERQNNLCIYTGNGFIKIPLPHELRVFHAMGDNIYQASFGRKDITQTILDVILSFSDLIPANPMGAIQGSWADIMPDATKPFFQLQANRSFTGSRIINEWADPNKPGYLRIRTNKKGEPYAPAFLVKLGQSLDDATGGDGVEKGLISFNPDEVNHILRGYFGGLYTIGTQVLTIGDKIYELTDTGEFKMKIRETPLKTFYTSSDDLLTTSSGINSKYYKISDNAQEIRRKIKGYQEQALNGKLTTEEFAAKISKLSSDVEILNRIYPYMKQIKKYENALKDLEDEDQKDAEKIIANLKKEVIEINSMSK